MEKSFRDTQNPAEQSTEKFKVVGNQKLGEWHGNHRFSLRLVILNSSLPLEKERQ